MFCFVTLETNPNFFNCAKNPPGLCIAPSNASCDPIAFILNGELILFPFINITFPSHVIEVKLVILSSFIDIASAPAFFNSFTSVNKSVS